MTIAPALATAVNGGKGRVTVRAGVVVAVEATVGAGVVAGAMAGAAVIAADASMFALFCRFFFFVSYLYIKCIYFN